MKFYEQQWRCHSNAKDFLKPNQIVTLTTPVRITVVLLNCSAPENECLLNTTTSYRLSENKPCGELICRTLYQYKAINSRG